MKMPPSLPRACMCLPLALHASLRLAIDPPSQWWKFAICFLVSMAWFMAFFHELRKWWKS